MIHQLKTESFYFNAVRNGNKYFEIRKNDRNFNMGDRVILKELDPDSDTLQFTGRKIELTISHILYTFPGLEVGYCIFSFNTFRTVA